MILRGVVMACTLLGAAPVAAGEWAVKTERRDPPAELADPVGQSLGREAVVIAEDGQEAIVFWFAKELSARATEEQLRNGLTYRELPEGTLVGAVQFARPFIDYRKQEIAAGVYTLRFLIQPDVGDHMGTALHPEFLVLARAGDDRSTDGLEPRPLIKLSSAVTGGDHPAVLLLFPNTGKVAEPRLVARGEGVQVLTTHLPVEAEGKKGTLGFAITVAGHSKSR